MPRYCFIVYSNIEKSYCIKSHLDSFDWDYFQPRYIINKYRNMTHYKEQKAEKYKLFNSYDCKQLYLTQKCGIRKGDTCNTDLKYYIHNLIKKIQNNDLKNIKKQEKEIIEKLTRFKEYKCLDKLDRITDMKAYQKAYYENKNGITEEKKNEIKTIIDNIKNDDDFISKVVDMINENKENRKIIIKFLTPKERKAVSNKMSYLKRIS